MKKLVTLARLKEVLSYDPETGIFVWRVRRNGIVRAGDQGGSTSTGDGYVRLKLDERLYLAHRLAWLYMTGEWPSSEVDHRDLRRDNNKWSNLRLATDSQNRANTRAFKNNKSGFKGVHWHKGRGRWTAAISKDGLKKSLGYFPTPEAAHASYMAAASSSFGEFSRTA